MKNLRLLLFIGLSFVTISVSAQGKFGVGADSVECIQNLGFYEDYYRQNDIKSAYPYWLKALEICPPGASQNLYIRGIRIMKESIESTNDPTTLRARVDTLIMLYENRMEHFPTSDKALITASIALDVMKYMQENEETIYEAFQKAVETGKEKTDPNVLVIAMQSVVNMYNSDKLSAEKVIESFTTISGYAQAAVKADPMNEKTKEASQAVENLFLTCNAASCEVLEPLFKARFDQNPNDKDMVASIVRLLNMKDCTGSDLYTQVAEAYYRLEPSGASAHALALMFLAKKEIDKSIDYLRKSIDATTDADEKSTYLMELSTIYFNQRNNASLAAQAAKQSIALNSQNGKAYLLLGTIWAGQHGKCGGGNEIETASVFWVAVDFFNRAKQVDPSLSTDANRAIASYSQYFPLQADAFMFDLVDGNPYTVNCGSLSERTTVRTRK